METAPPRTRRTGPTTAEAPDVPPTRRARLTTGDVATRLGVAPATLRSWARRYGLGPSGHQGGRHRRWSEQDVAMLERLCELTARGVPTAEAAELVRSAGGMPVTGQMPAAADMPAAANTPGTGDMPGNASVLSVSATPRQRTPARSGADAAAILGTTTPHDDADARRRVRGLGRAAVRLDAPLLDELLAGTLAEYGLVDAWERVLSPALRSIGRTWACSGDPHGERYVEAEHLLSWHLSTALRRSTGCAATSPTAPGGRPVLLACVPGEAHTLGLEALTAALGERGVPVRMFGAAVPVGALTEAVRRTGPCAVVLWSQTRATAAPALLSLAYGPGHGLKGSRVHPAVLAAGPGWSRRGAPGIHRPGGLQQALQILEGFAVPERLRPTDTSVSHP
ncbi:MerR family transcriptional regulator [Streptomyces niger]|uniref:MerR family transcriptional regulator n=1 Tax=Streptomyces niger TaxID=66373 RepID=UPI000DA60F69|nr:MerR family transcriptional regulator [Streptomyces niger]